MQSAGYIVARAAIPNEGETKAGGQGDTCAAAAAILQLPPVLPTAGQCQSPQQRPYLTTAIKKSAAFWQSPGAVMR